jgi:UDP-N-acetylglucosamine:LPS N-acetylglucosamine transferase
MNKYISIDMPFVMIYDYLGDNSMSWNPRERWRIYKSNQWWVRNRNFFKDDQFSALFIGELEDIPNKRLGPFLPNGRDLARDFCQFVGYVLPFDPADYSDKAKIRTKLGYGDNPLVICSIGGTKVGKGLLALCGQSYTMLKDEIPNLQMVLVCGPRLASESLSLPQAVEIKGYIPNLYEHFAACDLAIVQAGGTTTLELTALKQPFLYFPLDGHFEQQIHVSGRLARHRAGVKMYYTHTTPKSLAKKIKSTLGKDVNYLPIATDGAKRAAQIINQLL